MAQQPPPPQWARASSISRLHDHIQTHYTWYDSSGRGISPTQGTLPDNTQNRERLPCHRRDSNPQSQQGSGRRTTPWTTRAAGSFQLLKFTFKNINFTYYRVCKIGRVPLYMISSFRREVDKNCYLLCYYAAGSVNFVPTFRHNLPVPPSGWRLLLLEFRDNLLVLSLGVKNSKGFLPPEYEADSLSRNAAKRILDSEEETDRLSRNVGKKLPLLAS